MRWQADPASGGFLKTTQDAAPCACLYALPTPPDQLLMRGWMVSREISSQLWIRAQLSSYLTCWHTPPTEPALIFGKQMIWAIRGLLHKRTGQTVVLLLLLRSAAQAPSSSPGGASLHPGISTTLALCWEPWQTIWPLLWAADTTSCYH